MFAKIINGAVAKYPYTVADLKAENPNTSFPASVDLTAYGAVHVVATGQPAEDITKTVTAGTPVFQNGRWEQTWIVTDASAEEVANRKADRRAGMQLSFAQMLIGLVAAGWITEAEGEAWLAGTVPAAVGALIGTLPAEQRFAAKARAVRPSVVLRTDPLVSALAAAQGKTEDELDTFFLTFAAV